MPAKIQKYYLFPGTLFAHRSPHLVTTVLGSCVSVCLWDTKNKFGGINHYNLPYWNGEGLATPKYGNIAIERLLEKMLRFGSKRSYLIAKIFGGGAVISSERNSATNIGEKNIVIALDIIEEAHIPIISSAVGGRQGRKLIYNTYSNEVLVKRIHNQYSSNPADA